MAPRILIFSIAMGADYSLEEKYIEIWVPKIFKHNNSFVATVVKQWYLNFNGVSYKTIFVRSGSRIKIAHSGSGSNSSLVANNNNNSCSSSGEDSLSSCAGTATASSNPPSLAVRSASSPPRRNR